MILNAVSEKEHTNEDLVRRSGSSLEQWKSVHSVCKHKITNVYIIFYHCLHDDKGDQAATLLLYFPAFWIKQLMASFVFEHKSKYILITVV